MKRGTVLLTALVVGVALFLSKGKSKTTADKRGELVAWAVKKGEFPVVSIFNEQMTDAEIEAAHAYIFDYYEQGKRPDAGTDLYNKISAIQQKYNIFT